MDIIRKYTFATVFQINFTKYIHQKCFTQVNAD